QGDTEYVDVLTDQSLIRQFLQRDEAAFRGIVERHGAMVFAVALRTLRDRQAAEDVVQATFFVLARNARSIQRHSSLAAWLHAVAIRIARKALRRRQQQPVSVEHPDAASEANEPYTNMTSVYEAQIVDEELSGLPAHYRNALILHFLEGLTFQQTAQALKTTVGAIEGWLKRGKRALRLRLMRRGIGVGMVFAAFQWSQSAARASQLTSLFHASVAGGMSTAAGSPFGPAVSAEAIHLAREFSMWTTTKVVLTGIASVLLLTAAGLVGNGVWGDEGHEAPALSTAVIETPEENSSSEEPASAVPVQIAQNTPDPDETKVYPVDDLIVSTNATNSTNSTSTVPPTVEVYAPGASNPNIARIHNALTEETNMEFPGNPLSDVIDYTALMHNIPILIDEAALAEEGIDTDVEVELVLQGVTLQSALEIILADVGGTKLDFVIENEVMKVTTRIAADEIYETRVYDVRALELDDPEVLVHVLTNTTSGAWVQAGTGEGAISYSKGSFIIRQTQRVHREIETLLNNMAKQAASKNYPVPDWPTPKELPPFIPPNSNVPGGTQPSVSAK
ncbi:MAG: RNA polymerase sigma factor, partial [Planctomycetaceae bacterium]|nr:RNA polymerase sigma factor [Planctomycetaceae bacterium]